MTTTTDEAMKDLILRLEAATGRDRILDADIFRLIGLTELQERHCRDWCHQDGRTDLTPDRYIQAWAPDYTSSIDAALTLVPSDHAWALDHCRLDRGAFVCPDKDGWTESNGFEAKAATCALALCIAALRARAAVKGE